MKRASQVILFSVGSVGLLIGWLCGESFRMAGAEVASARIPLKPISDVASNDSAISPVDRLLSSLALLTPEQLSRRIASLSADSDAILAIYILRSDLADTLSEKQILELSVIAANQDQRQFADWVATTLPTGTKRAETLLASPIFLFMTDGSSMQKVAASYIGALEAGKPVNLKSLADGLLLVRSRIEQGSWIETISKIKSIPVGFQSEILAGEMGRSSNVPPESLLPQLSGLSRAAYIIGVLQAGKDLDQPQLLITNNDQPAVAQGMLRHELDAGTFTSQNTPLLERALREGAETADKLADVILYSEKDPAAAIGELCNCDSPEIDGFVGSLVSRLAGSDPVQASEILDSLPKVPDTAILALISEIKDDPEASLAWSLRLTNEQARETATEKYLKELRLQDAGKAENYKQLLRTE